MDKKLLVSLMMTAPLTSFAAYYQYVEGGNGASDYLKYVIDSSVDSWSAKDGILSASAGAEDSNLVVPIGFKSGVTHNGIMPIGTYSFNFSGFGGNNNSILVVNGDPQVEKMPYQDANGNDVVDASGKKVLVPGYWENVKDENGNDIVTENGGHVVKWVKVGNTEYSKMIPLARGTFKFESKSDNKTLSLLVVPKDSSKPYTVGNVEGQLLNFSFTSCYNTLNTRFADATTAKGELPASVTGVPEGQVKGLSDRLKALNTTYATIQKNLATVNPAQTVPSDSSLGQILENAYNSFNLNLYSTSKDGISTAIANFVKEVATFNADLKAQQTILDNMNGNANAYQTLQNKILNLRNSINNAENNLIGNEGNKPSAPNAQSNPNYATQKAVYDYQMYMAENSVNYFKTSVNAFEQKVEEAYADYKTATEPIAEYQALLAEANAISNQISSVATGNPYTTAANDWNTYAYFINASTTCPAGLTAGTQLSVAKDERDKVFFAIQKLITEHTLYLDIFDSTVAELDKVYNNNEGYAINQTNGLVVSNPNIIGAYSNYALASTQMVQRIADMKAVYNNLSTLQTSEDSHYKTANTQLNNAKVEGEAADGNYRLNAIFSIPGSTAFSLFPEDVQKDINKYITALEEAYKAWGTATENLYKAHNLWNLTNNDWNSDWSAAKQKFVDAYDSYVTNVEGNTAYAGSIKIITTYEVAVAHLNTLATNGNENGKSKYGAELKDKFQDTIDDIKAVVDQYVSDATDDDKDTVADPDAPANVATACENLTNTADTLFAAFIDAENAIAKAQSSVDSFNSEFDAAKKKVLSYTADGKPVYDFSKAWNFNRTDGTTVKGQDALTATGVQSKINEYNSQLQKIADGQGDYTSAAAAYTAALKVSETVGNDNYAGKVNDGRVNFAKAVADANKTKLAALESQIQTIKSNTALQPTADKKTWAPGLEAALKINAGNLPSGCPSSSTGIIIPSVPSNSVTDKAAADYIKTINNLDSQMISIANAIKAQYEALEAVQTNFDNNTALVSSLGQVQTTLNNVSFLSAIDYNTVKDYYQGEVKKIQKAIDDETKTLSAAYSNMGFKDAAGKKTYQDQIDAIKGQITTLVNLFNANESAYSSLVTEISSVSESATSLYASIDANNKVPEDRKKWLAKLDEINNQLKAISDKVKASYGSGAVSANSESFSEQIDALQKNIDEIQTNESTGYLDAVRNSNEAYLNNLGISADQLNEQYNAAVNQVNSYRYDINNAGYYAALMTNESFVKAHSDLQACHQQVIDLITQRNSYLTSLVQGQDETKWVVLADVNPDGQANNANADSVVKSFYALQKANTAITTLISTTLNKVVNDAWNTAKTYFATKFTNGAQAYYSQVATALGLRYSGLDAEEVDELLNKEELGKMTDVLEEINLQYYGDADEEVKGLEALMNTNKSAYILGMDKIADNIDLLLPQNGETGAEFVQNKINLAYSLLWTEEYNDVVGSLNSGLNASGLPAAEKKQIEDALKDAAKVNTDWNKLAANARQANYLTLKGQLDTATAAALSTVKKNANQTAFDQLTSGAESSELTQTNDILEDLLEYSGYHQSQLNTYAYLQGQVNQLVDDAKNDPDLAENIETYEEDFEALRESLSDVSNYYSMFIAECRYAKTTLLVMAKNAFNNARAYEAAQGEAAQSAVLDNYNVELANIAANIANLEATKAKDFTDDNKDEFKADILAQEEALCKIIAELEAIAHTAAKDTDLGKAQANIDKLYNAASDQLTALSGKIANGVTTAPDYAPAFADKYNADVEELQGDLDQVKNAVEPAGDNLLMDNDKLVYELGQYQNDVNKLESSWQAAQNQADKFQISDNVYASCMEKVDALWATVAEAKGLADGLAEISYVWQDGQQVEVSTPISDKTLTQYNTIYNAIKGKNGLINTLNSLKASHALTEGYTMADYSSQAANYVKPTLDNVAKWYRTSDINEIISIINADDEVNEKGWKYSYMNSQELVDQLTIALNKFLRDPYTEDYIYKNIYLTPDAKDPSKLVNANAEQALANYNNVKALFDAVMADVEGIKKSMEEKKYIKGDVDDNGDINVLDVQTLLTKVGEGVDFEPGSTTSASQDVNSDNTINIADVTALINIIINNQRNSVANRLRAFMPRISGDNSFVCEEIQGENGMRRFAINLANEVTFTAGQIDIKLPGYARVANVQVGERANELDAYVFENNGYTRVLLTALDNAFIEGNNGCVLYIDVEGNADIEVENVIFADANGNAHNISGNGTSTGVGIMDAVKDGVKAIYNAAGQKLNKLTKGVNIIRNADGTTTKKIGK